MLCCKNLWFQHISRVILSSVFLFSMCEWKITVLYHVLVGKKKKQLIIRFKLKLIAINFVLNVHVQVWNKFFLIWTTCKLAINITVHQRERTLFLFWCFNCMRWQGESLAAFIKYGLTHTIFNKHTQCILECMCHILFCASKLVTWTDTCPFEEEELSLVTCFKITYTMTSLLQ